MIIDFPKFEDAKMFTHWECRVGDKMLMFRLHNTPKYQNAIHICEYDVKSADMPKDLLIIPFEKDYYEYACEIFNRLCENEFNKFALDINGVVE